MFNNYCSLIICSISFPITTIINIIIFVVVVSKTIIHKTVGKFARKRLGSWVSSFKLCITTWKNVHLLLMYTCK